MEEKLQKLEDYLKAENDIIADILDLVQELREIWEVKNV